MIFSQMPLIQKILPIQKILNISNKFIVRIKFRNWFSVVDFHIQVIQVFTTLKRQNENNFLYILLKLPC